MMEDINIKRKPERINQKVPTSNIVPKKDTGEVFEKKADKKKAKTPPIPPNKETDLGRLIFPSKNRAKPQQMIQTASPTTKSNPFEVSIGILVKGRKKSGNNTMTKNSAQNENLSNIFVFIDAYYTIC